MWDRESPRAADLQAAAGKADFGEQHTMGGLSCKASANCFEIPLKKQQQQLWGRGTQSCASEQGGIIRILQSES